jgi:hypothetical protein
MESRDLQGSITWKKFSITVFEFIGKFFFQNYVFKLQEVFSEHRISVFIENGLESLQTFVILKIRYR